MRQLPTASIEDVLSWNPCFGWSKQRLRAWWENLKLPERVTAVTLLSRGVNGAGKSIRDDLSWAAHHLLPMGLEVQDMFGVPLTYGHSIYEDCSLGTNALSHDRAMLRLLREWVKNEAPC